MSIWQIGMIIFVVLSAITLIAGTIKLTQAVKNDDPEAKSLAAKFFVPGGLSLVGVVICLAGFVITTFVL